MKNLILGICLLFANIGLADSDLPKNYPGHDIIGMGYNVFGEFANNKSIQPYPLFDFNKMSKKESNGYSMPRKVFLKEVNEHIIETVEGSSISEYVTNLSQDAGLSANAYFFKASVENHFQQDTESKTGVFYYTYMDLNTKWKISMDSRNIDTLKNYLDPQFASDLANMDPKELFYEYGTHFISSAYIGGRIDFSSFTRTTEDQIKTEVRNAISGKYKIISGEYQSNESYDNLIQKLQTKTRLSVVGGSSEFTRDISSAEQYESWAASLSNRPALCGFGTKSLKPIWLLCKDSERAKELENYFNKIILKQHKLPIYFQKDPVLDNNDLSETFALFFTGFQIHQDCDPPSTFIEDKAGEFSYGIEVYVNDNFVTQIISKEGFVYKAWSGEFLQVNQRKDFTVDLQPGARISIKFWLKEHETYESDDLLGPKTVTFRYPFSKSHIYNYTDAEGNQYWRSENTDLYRDSKCYAQIYLQLMPTYNETANEYGKKGWQYFLSGNMEESLAYSKRALELDNSTWFVQYNVALIYLIQGNPLAYEKYVLIAKLCPSAESARGAYQDIIDYESKNGPVEGSEEIKILLKNKFS